LTGNGLEIILNFDNKKAMIAVSANMLARAYGIRPFPIENHVQLLFATMEKINGFPK
jgi:hypothetical protein